VSIQEPIQPIEEPPLSPESKFYFGWLMLPVATLMVICTLPGQTVVVSQFNTAIRDNLGISLELLSTAYLIGTLAASFPLTYVGKVSDHIGPRQTTAVVVLGLLLGCATLASATNIYSLTLGFFLIRLLGQGALGMLSSHLLALWFERRLATVESIKHAGMSLASAASPFVVISLIAATNWRTAYIILGLTVAVLILPLVATIFRNKPEDIGQHLDNEPPELHKRWHEIHEQRTTPKTETVFTLKQARSTLAFWAIAMPGILSGLVGTAMIFHIQPILIASGVENYETVGAAALSTWAGVQFIVILIAGPIADKFSPRILLPISTTLTAISIAAMALATTGTTTILAMGIFGVGQGIGMSTSGPAIARFFGRPHHGSIRGFLTTLMVAGTALGPYLLAKGADLSGDSFKTPLLAFAAGAILIAAITTQAKKPASPISE
jgi:OFA family oxalate/formate antiporter-like MFS transporter